MNWWQHNESEGSIVADKQQGPSESAVDRLFSKKPHWPRDTRTEAQKMQQKLWQLRGTLHRTKANLDDLRHRVSGIRCIILSDALNVIDCMIDENQAAMQRLPNKKRLAHLEKSQGVDKA